MAPRAYPAPVLQTTIDGVPVFIAEGPPPLTAGLMFGVGRADETFVRGGITHLVEHLTMRAVGRTTIECNASVDLSRTEFIATGAPDQVAGFLRAVCDALADLPTDRLAVEADVLRTEGGRAAPPLVGGLLGERYGTTGPGLAGVREPAVRSLTADDVRQWVRTYFTRGNAALWLSGPVPEGLTLPLAEGSRPPREPLQRRDIPVPGWAEFPVEGQVALGGELPAGPAGSVALEVLRRRVEDELRHRRGVAYDVGADRLALDADTRFGVLMTDVRAGQEDLAARVLWRELQRLAQDGPLPAELDHERAVIAGHLDDPRSAADEAQSLAEARVTGIPVLSSDELRRELDALTPDAVRHMAARLRDGVVLGVPQALEPPPADLARLPQWSPAAVPGRTFARRRGTGVPKGATLVVGPEGASVVLSEGQRVTVRWVDAVGLVRLGPGELLLLGRDGFSVPLSAADWRDGDEAVALVQAAVPVELQVTDDDLHEGAGAGDGVLLLRAPAHRVREAIGLSWLDTTIVYNGEWTALVPDPRVPAELRLAELSPTLGSGCVALVLHRTHADLEYVLLRGGKEVGRHTWGVAPGDPRLLAEATGRPLDHVTYLHGVVDEPGEIAAHAVQALGLPWEVPDLLAGREVAGERVIGRGIAGGFRASVSGAYDPPPGTTGVIPWWEELNRTRPAWFRGVNALLAVLGGVGLWLLVTADHGLSGRLFATVVGLAVLALLTGAWCTLPARRSAAREPVAQARPPVDVTSSG